MTSSSWPQRIVETFAVLLLGIGLAAAQVLIGGTRLVFSLPGYGFVAVAGLLVLLLLRLPRPAPNTWCLLASALFFGYVIGRALLSPVPHVARTDLYIVLGSLVVYGFTATLFTGAKSRVALLLFLLLLGMVHSFIGAIQFRDGNNFMPIPFLQRPDHYGARASGFYVCPNHLAGLLEVLGVFGISLVCWSRLPVWGKLLVGYVTAICYAGALLTGSRGGYLSIAASLLAFALLSFVVLRKIGGSLPWKLTGVGLLIGLVAAGAVFASLRKSPVLNERATNIAEVNNMRLELWKAALEQWRTSPIWGTGAATYRYFGRRFRTETMQGDPFEAHNDYVQLLAEYGVVGVAAFLAFFGVHLGAGWRDFQRIGPKRVAVAPRLLSNNLALHLGALSAVAAYVVHSALDFNLHIPANALLLALVFGIIANPGVRGGREPEAPGIGSIVPRLAVVALAAVLLIQCVRLFPGEYYAERARMAVRDGQTGLAMRFALEGLKYETRNPDIYAHLGRARLAFGSNMQDPAAQNSFYRAAVDAFEKARALAPLEQSFYLTLGLLYDLLGRFDEGENVLKGALALDPRSTYVREYYQAHIERRQEAAAQPTPTPAPPPETNAAPDDAP